MFWWPCLLIEAFNKKSFDLILKNFSPQNKNYNICVLNNSCYCYNKFKAYNSSSTGVL